MVKTEGHGKKEKYETQWCLMSTRNIPFVLQSFGPHSKSRFRRNIWLNYCKNTRCKYQWYKHCKKSRIFFRNSNKEKVEKGNIKTYRV